MEARIRLTRGQAADVLGKSTAVVSRLFRQGVVEGVREGGRLFLFADSVEAYARRCNRPVEVVVIIRRDLPPVPLDEACAAMVRLLEGMVDAHPERYQQDDSDPDYDPFERNE